MDPAAAPASDLTAEQRASVLRQLEYYFCDLSFPFDDFLKSQAEEDGSIAASVLAGSPRVVSLTSGLDEAARLALLLSLAEESDSVVVAGESRLKRRYPLPAEDPAAARSVYLAGLPKDADEEAVKELLAQAKQAASYGPVLSVRRLRDLQKGRAFTGQVFVEVEDEEKAAALLKAASHGAVDCKKAKLLTDFFESQAASIREQKAKREAKAAGGGAPAAAADGGAGSKRAREEPPERGCVLAFEGVGGEATRDQISALCARCAGGEDAVAFVEFYPGNSAGFARFRTAAAAGAALGALGEGKEEVGGAAPSWRLLGEEEEAAYREKTKKHKSGGKGGKGKGKGGKGKGKGKGKGGKRD